MSAPRYITLTNSDQRATVDAEDFDFLDQFEWFLDEPTGYVTTITDDGVLVFMQDTVWHRHHKGASS